MPQVAQGMKDVARAGEKDAECYHQNFNERAMWQVKRTGQRAKEAEEENTARYDRRKKRVEEDEKGGRFAQHERSDTEWSDSPPDERVIFQQHNQHFGAFDKRQPENDETDETQDAGDMHTAVNTRHSILLALQVQRFILLTIVYVIPTRFASQWYE